MTMEGSTCDIITNPPTDDYIREYKKFYYQMNLIGIYQIICLKFLQWRRSIGKVQIFIDISVLLREESHVHLQQSSVDMTWEYMSLIYQWQMFSL